MQSTLIKLTGGGQTSWFASDAIGHPCDAAALLSRALQGGGLSAASLEEASGGTLRPMGELEYTEATLGFLTTPDSGLLVEIDLESAQAGFTYWGTERQEAYQICAPVEQIASGYDAAKQDLGRFFCELVSQSSWHATPVPSELFAAPEQEQAMGMAMM